MRKAKRFLAAVVALAISIPTAGLVAPAAAAAPVVGQGFTVTPSDLAFILKQIKIAEAHVANTTSATGPVRRPGRHRPQPDRQPARLQGLRTVDGSCNNLVPGQETIGAADQVFPRLAPESFRPAEIRPARSARPRRPSLRAEVRQRLRLPAPRDQQPDRGPDVHQPGRRGRGRIPGQDPGQPGRRAVHHRSRPAATRRSRPRRGLRRRRTRRCSSPT